jgi:hypothetical protein
VRWIPEWLRWLGAWCAATAIVCALALAVGCGTLKVTPREYADIEIRVMAPHILRAVVDGETRYEQTGPQRLRLRARAGTTLIADDQCADGWCTLRDSREQVTP